jgi:hypothetical protein
MSKLSAAFFEALAPLVGVEVELGSIRQEPPPAPDIECRAIGSGPRAVELVALDAQHTRTQLENMRLSNQTWVRALAERSPAEQEELKARSDDMLLSVHMSEAAGTRVRTRIMSVIQNRMRAMPENFSGPIFNEHNAPVEVNHASVSHGHVEGGPHISTSSAGSWLPPQLDKIREVLVDKNYRTDAPLELFVTRK